MPVNLFGTAGGGWEAIDCCFIGFASVQLIVILLLAGGGFLRGSMTAAMTALLFALVIGGILLPAFATMKPTNDPDEIPVHDDFRALIGFWDVVTVISAFSAGSVAVRQMRKRGEKPQEPSSVRPPDAK